MKQADYNKLCARAAQLQTELGNINEQLEEFRLEQLRKVEVKRNERSTTLLYNGRTLNVKRGMWGRFQIKEKGKVLVNEFSGNVHDIRFAVALGQL